MKRSRETLKSAPFSTGYFTTSNSELNLVAFCGESTIDCDDCKTYWLIKQNLENQIFETQCKNDNSFMLFDVGTKTKLSQKCKWFDY